MDRQRDPYRGRTPGITPNRRPTVGPRPSAGQSREAARGYSTGQTARPTGFRPSAGQSRGAARGYSTGQTARPAGFEPSAGQSRGAARGHSTVRTARPTEPRRAGAAPKASRRAPTARRGWPKLRALVLGLIALLVVLGIASAIRTNRDKVVHQMPTIQRIDEFKGTITEDT